VRQGVDQDMTTSRTKSALDRFRTCCLFLRFRADRSAEVVIKTPIVRCAVDDF
jgi:hypothetical protein